MARYCERPECAEISSVFERDQAEWDDDQENGFLVDVISEKERGVSAERDRADKRFPVGTKPELDQRELPM